MSYTPFTESTIPSTINVSSTGSINTFYLDPYRQGVELTRPNHFQQGFVKIWSGEADHELLINDFGQDEDEIFVDTTAYTDIDKFNAVVYLSSQNEYQQNLTYPIVIDSSTPLNLLNMNGIIEPLEIRREITFTSIDTPFTLKTINANLEDGNYNKYSNADIIVDKVIFAEKTNGSMYYEDNIDSIGGQPANIGYFPTVTTNILPFNDSSLKSGIQVSNNMQLDLKNVLTQMSPSSDNYLPNGYESFVKRFDDE